MLKFPFFRARARQRAATTAAPGAAALPISAPDHLRFGRAGEDAAAAFLERAGYGMLDRNWRQGRLELDLVCRDGETVVFVEVKSRKARGQGSPAEAVTPAKQRVLGRAAQAWLAAHQAWQSPCRFDVVCVLRDGDILRLEHHRHAFDFSPALDSGHAPWQPW